MGYFHLENDFFISRYKENLIGLCLRTGSYVLFNTVYSRLIFLILSTPFEESGGLFYPRVEKKNEDISTKDLNSIIEKLRKMKILSPKMYKKKEALKSLSCRRSGLHSDHLVFCYRQFYKPTSLLLVLEAYMILLYIFFLLKCGGFHTLIKRLNKHSSFSQRISPKRAVLTNLSSALNKASFYLPFNTECLEWSSALFLMCHRRNWDCHLKIGVQSFPFYAHAWVQTSNNVIADSKDLPNRLSIILSVPFPN